MANILFGVTGSVAAIRTPLLFERLRQAGHAVKVVATRAALYFFDPAELDSSHAGRNPQVVVLDEDEWPGQRWQRDDPVLHIELRRWADLFLIAPLDANTLAKLAHGVSDNCLTCVWRAWDAEKPVVLAPAMNTLMWENRLTARHVLAIAANAGAGEMPSRSNELGPEAAIQWVNDPARQIHLRIVPPISKKLACGDVGMGGMADVSEIENAVRAMLPQ